MTTQYKKILVAVDLNANHNRCVIERAKALAGGSATALYLVHAIEHIDAYGTASAFHNIASMENQIAEEHKNVIIDLAKQYNIDQQQVYVMTGMSNQVLSALAEKIGADLIIVGYHVRHGLSVLLGSTAGSLLHHANCDLLVVRLPS